MEDNPFQSPTKSDLPPPVGGCRRLLRNLAKMALVLFGLQLGVAFLLLLSIALHAETKTALTCAVVVGVIAVIVVRSAERIPS